MSYKERLARDVAHETMKTKVKELIRAFKQEVYRQTYFHKEVRVDDLLDGIKQLDEQGVSIKYILDDRSGGGGWIILIYGTETEDESINEIKDDEEEEEEEEE